jgi:hypothetical protein
MFRNLETMKTMTPNPHDYKTISSYFNYNPDTGIITWKIKRSNRKPIGSIAGVVDSNGYRRIKVTPKLYLAHRIAWLLYYKQWPDKIVDHINMNVDDNRICNLRIATNSQNMMNASKYKSNSTGFKGVHYRSREKRFVGQITINRQKFNTKYCKTPEEAHQELKKLRKLHHKEFARY